MPGILGKITRNSGRTREIIHDALTSWRPVLNPRVVPIPALVSRPWSAGPGQLASWAKALLAGG